MAPPIPARSLLGDILGGIGRKRDRSEIEAGYAIVKKRNSDQLESERQKILRRSLPIASLQETSRERKNICKVQKQGNIEVIQLDGNTEDIDVNYEYKDFDGALNHYNKLV